MSSCHLRNCQKPLRCWLSMGGHLSSERLRRLMRVDTHKRCVPPGDFSLTFTGLRCAMLDGPGSTTSCGKALRQPFWMALRFSYPSAEDFLVHTIAHGVRRGSSGALWRQDVRTLLAGRAVKLNWARVIKTSANYRVSPLVARALESVAEELPSKTETADSAP